MRPLLTKSPTSFELKILSFVMWVVGTISALLIVSALAHNTKERWRCESACESKGYPGFRYGTDRRRVPACYCLTREENEIENRLPKGIKIDFPAE